MLLPSSVSRPVALRALALGLPVLVVASLAACSSSVPSSNDAGAPDASVVDATPDGATLDATSPTDAQAVGSPIRDMAIKRLVFGDRDPSGMPAIGAWKSIGRNLDGLASTSSSRDHCALPVGAPNRVKDDGQAGIDNSFGANIAPLLGVISPDLAADHEKRTTAGGATVVVHVDGLDGVGGLGGSVVEAAPTTSPPGWGGSDARAIAFESLVDGTLAGGPKQRFTKVTERDGAIVAEVAELVVTVEGVPFAISQAQISFPKPSPGTREIAGTISGILPLDRFSADFRRAAGRLSTGLCELSTLDNVVQQIALSVDIRDDLTNAAGTDCNAISIGLGFVAVPIAAPAAVAPKREAPPDPCVK